MDNRDGAMLPLADVSAGEWIAGRLGPFGGWVGSIVARGYDRYARILHPVDLHDGHARPNLLRWADVCAATGYQPHRRMHWYDVAGITISQTREEPSGILVQGREARWPDGEPHQGTLPRPELAVLRRVLREHTAPGSGCFFAVWEGQGWCDPPPWATEQALAGGGRLRHENRDYILLAGTLDTTLYESARENPHSERSANLFWPADRAWCVATEVDFDSTLVGGSTELIAAILAEPDLEVWEVEPDDDLAWYWPDHLVER
jgi:hypothetical protein